MNCYIDDLLQSFKGGGTQLNNSYWQSLFPSLYIHTYTAFLRHPARHRQQGRGGRGGGGGGEFNLLHSSCPGYSYDGRIGSGDTGCAAEVRKTLLPDDTHL